MPEAVVATDGELTAARRSRATNVSNIGKVTAVATPRKNRRRFTPAGTNCDPSPRLLGKLMSSVLLQRYRNWVCAIRLGKFNSLKGGLPERNCCVAAGRGWNR